MCTVSWAASPGGYDLWFNRDELHTRAPEQPPSPGERDGVAFLAPRDGDHGGTWLAVNAHGLTVCLLNDYASPWQPAAGTAHHSRGHLVLACAGAESADAVEEIVRVSPLGRTRPFRLITLERNGAARLLHWAGGGLTRQTGAAVAPPYSSSSYATESVLAARARRFREFVRDPARPRPEALAAFHLQHDPDAGAHSVLMRRPDAATRSVSRVSVRADGITLAHAPVPWPATGAAPRLEFAKFTLPLR